MYRSEDSLLSMYVRSGMRLLSRIAQLLAVCLCVGLAGCMTIPGERETKAGPATLENLEKAISTSGSATLSDGYEFWFYGNVAPTGFFGDRFCQSGEVGCVQIEDIESVTWIETKTDIGDTVKTTLLAPVVVPAAFVGFSIYHGALMGESGRYGSEASSSKTKRNINPQRMWLDHHLIVDSNLGPDSFRTWFSPRDGFSSYGTRWPCLSGMDKSAWTDIEVDADALSFMLAHRGVIPGRCIVGVLPLVYAHDPAIALDWYLLGVGRIEWDKRHCHAATRREDHIRINRATPMSYLANLSETQREEAAKLMGPGAENFFARAETLYAQPDFFKYPVTIQNACRPLPSQPVDEAVLAKYLSEFGSSYPIRQVSRRERGQPETETSSLENEQES